jgi:hypothetical protein
MLISGGPYLGGGEKGANEKQTGGKITFHFLGGWEEEFGVVAIRYQVLGSELDSCTEK